MDSDEEMGSISDMKVLISKSSSQVRNCNFIKMVVTAGSTRFNATHSMHVCWTNNCSLIPRNQARLLCGPKAIYRCF
jgi:ABC-type antimicrobial peptide transport system permease subunit